MKRFIVPVLVVLVGSASTAADDKPMPKLPLGKDTTVVNGPLDKDGYIDYEAVINERMGKGVTPETNTNVLIWKALGPRPEGGDKGMPKEYFLLLGIDEPPTDGNYCLSMGRYIRDTLHDDPVDTHPFYKQQGQAIRRPWATERVSRVPRLAATEREATRCDGRSEPTQERTSTRWSPSGRPPAGRICFRRSCRAFSGVARSWRRCSVGRSTMRKTGEEKYDDAWADLLAAHRLARHVGRGGTLIETLVGCACEQVIVPAELALLLERAEPRHLTRSLHSSPICATFQAPLRSRTR